MDLSDGREVQRIVYQVLGERLVESGKDCPKCGTEVTMVKFNIQVWKDREKDDYEYVPHLRCLGCLTLYNEVLQEVKGE